MVEPRSHKELSHSIDMILAREAPRRGFSAGSGDQKSRPAETPTPEETRGTKASRVMLARHRRVRTTFSAEQLLDLENAFQTGRYPSARTRGTLASHTHLSETKIQIWFQNRRARWRRSEGGTNEFPCGPPGSEPDTPIYVLPPLPPLWLPPTNHLPVHLTAFLAVGPGYYPVPADLRPLGPQHHLLQGPWLPRVPTGTPPLQGHVQCV